MNPCKECIVNPMCRKSCFKFTLYIDKVLTSEGIAVHYGGEETITKLCDWLRDRLNEQLLIITITLRGKSRKGYNYSIRVNGEDRTMELIKEGGETYERKPM